MGLVASEEDGSLEEVDALGLGGMVEREALGTSRVDGRASQGRRMYRMCELMDVEAGNGELTLLG
jgi:hypothetical protein